jgi:hypothetical protein
LFIVTVATKIYRKREGFIPSKKKVQEGGYIAKEGRKKVMVATISSSPRADAALLDAVADDDGANDDDPRSPIAASSNDAQSMTSNTHDRYYTPHFFPSSPQEEEEEGKESPVEESGVATSTVVTEITSNALSAKMKFARLREVTSRGEISQHQTVMEDVETEEEEGDLLNEERQLEQRKLAYATSVLCPVCTAPFLEQDSLADTLHPEQTNGIIIHRSQSSSLVAAASGSINKMASYSDSHNKLPHCYQQSGCSFLLPLSAFMDGLCVGPTTKSSKECRIHQAGHLSQRHHPVNELVTADPNDLPPYCGKCKSFIVSEGEDDPRRDQILLNLSTWLMSTGSKDEAEAAGEGGGIEMQVLDDDPSRTNVVIVGDEQSQDRQTAEEEAINTEGASDDMDQTSSDIIATSARPDPFAEYLGAIGESGSVESIDTHDFVEYIHGTGHALMNRDKDGEGPVTQESTEIQAVSTLEEERTIVSHYEET